MVNCQRNNMTQIDVYVLSQEISKFFYSLVQDLLEDIRSNNL